MIDYLIDVGRKHDQGYVRSSWLESFWHRNGIHSNMRRGSYIRGQTVRIRRILRKSKLLVARPPDWPEGILGYIVSSDGAIHWWQVKTTYRTHGVGRGLLHSALEEMGVDPRPKSAEALAALRTRDALKYTHERTPYTQALWSRGLIYDPYEVERMIKK